jgi:hypothetical protein
MMLTMTMIRIDNQIVEKIEGGISITPIRMYERMYDVYINRDVMPFVSTGSRRKNSLLMQQLLDGTVLFDDLNVMCPV